MADTYVVSITLEGRDAASAAIDKVNRALKQTKQEADSTSTSSRNLGFSMDGLRQAALGAVTAFGAMQIVDKIAEINELGIQVRNTSATFEELAGGPAKAAEALELLNASTGGVVDNMTLMQASSKLLLTGLAESSEEAARLTEIGVKLGAAMGMDAASGLDNFSAALLNMSYERLDQLGISAGRVREQVKALKETGMSTEDAFRFAVLQEGGAALEKLSTAADTASSSFKRLEKAAGDAWAQFSNFIADRIETGAMVIEIGVITVQQEIEQHAQMEAAAAAAAEQAEARGYIIGQQLSEGMTAGLDPSFLGLFVEGALQELALDPALAQQAQLTGEQIQALLTNSLANIDQNTIRLEAQALGGDANFDQIYGNLAADIQRRNLELEQASQINSQRMQDAAETAWKLISTATEGAMEVQRSLFNQVQEFGTDIQTGPALMDATEAAQQLYGIVSGLGDYDGITVISPEQLGMVEQYARTFEIAMTEIEALNEQGLITDEQLESYKLLNEQVNEYADSAQNAADATDAIKASLSQMLGQQNGGALGQATDALIAYMGDVGYEGDQIDGLQSILDLNSGRETELSQAFQQDILPTITAIYEEFGAEAAAAALQAYTEGMQAAVDNQQELTPMQAQMLTGYLFTPGAGQFEVLPGEGFNAISQREGIPVDQLQQRLGPVPHPGVYEGTGGLVPVDQAQVGIENLFGAFEDMGQDWLAPFQEMIDKLTVFDPDPYAQMATSMTSMQESGDLVANALQITSGYSAELAANMPVAADASADLADSMGDVTSRAGTLRDYIAEISGKVNTVRVNLAVNDPQGLLKLFGAGGLAGIVQDNGGSVPGSDDRSVPNRGR